MKLLFTIWLVGGFIIAFILTGTTMDPYRDFDPFAAWMIVYVLGIGVFGTLAERAKRQKYVGKHVDTSA
jgi:ABC-type multidrug transport system permease subunit